MNITRKNYKVYKFIHDFKERNDYSPSIREIMKKLRLKSPAPVQHHLYCLRAAGCLKWVPTDARTLSRPLSLEEVQAKVYPPLPGFKLTVSKEAA